MCETLSQNKPKQSTQLGVNGKKYFYLCLAFSAECRPMIRNSGTLGGTSRGLLSVLAFLIEESFNVAEHSSPSPQGSIEGFMGQERMQAGHIMTAERQRGGPARSCRWAGALRGPSLYPLTRLHHLKSPQPP